MRYEELSAATVRLTRSLKAVEEPRTMRDSRTEMNIVNRMDLIGSDVRGST